MKKNKLPLSAVLLSVVLLGIALGVCAQEDRNLIVPGKKVGLIALGKPIPREVLKSLGKPTSHTAPLPGKDGTDTGNYYWEGKLNVKLNDGRGDENVYQIFVLSPNYHTAEGIKVGASWEQVRRVYPKGKKIEVMDFDFGWATPGMVFSISGNKVRGIGVRITGRRE
ncbi:MAG: hypothetical protein HYU64_13785 [Armatimonadetes bacterium]|nr:hypothetical protein [Armatimonadota bacterium]